MEFQKIAVATLVVLCGAFSLVMIVYSARERTAERDTLTHTIQTINRAASLVSVVPEMAASESVPKNPQNLELATAPKAISSHVATPSQNKIEPPPPNKSDEFPVARVQEPYPYATKSFELINTETRAAVVNIFCTTGGMSLSPISASGVMIDSRGILITNAHVAQYVLLEQTTTIPISCRGRIGSPATDHYALSILYISPAWVKEHAGDLVISRPTGTGEHDWALLLATPLASSSIPYLKPDSREGIAFEGDDVLIAAYPAGFLGGFITSSGLYVSSAVTTIKQLFTFTDQGAIDLVSLGGSVLAQSGSSGGAVVNAWGRLVGLVVTSSDAETTAERDLRAITFAHIDRSMREQYGASLEKFLDSDVRAKADEFLEKNGIELAEKLTEVLKR